MNATIRKAIVTAYTRQNRSRVLDPGALALSAPALQVCQECGYVIHRDAFGFYVSGPDGILHACDTLAGVEGFLEGAAEGRDIRCSSVTVIVPDGWN